MIFLPLASASSRTGRASPVGRWAKVLESTWPRIYRTDPNDTIPRRDSTRDVPIQSKSAHLLCSLHIFYCYPLTIVLDWRLLALLFKHHFIIRVPEFHHPRQSPILQGTSADSRWIEERHSLNNGFLGFKNKLGQRQRVETCNTCASLSGPLSTSLPSKWL